MLCQQDARYSQEILELTLARESISIRFNLVVKHIAIRPRNALDSCVKGTCVPCGIGDSIAVTDVIGGAAISLSRYESGKAQC